MVRIRFALPLAVAAMLAFTAFTASSKPVAAEDAAPAAITNVADACAEQDAHAALTSLCEAYEREELPAWAKEALGKVILRLANGEHGHANQAFKACRELLKANPDANTDAAERCRTLLGEHEQHPEKLCRRVLAGEVANAPESLVTRCKALLEDEPARCRRLASQPEANATATEELRTRCRQLIGEKADEFCKRMMTLPQNATNVSPELKERCREALANATEQTLRRACATFAANPERAGEKAAELRERCQDKPATNVQTLDARCKELAANPQLATTKPDLKEQCARLLAPKPTPRAESDLDYCRRVLAGADAANADLLAKCKQLIEREGTPRPKPTATERAR